MWKTYTWYICHWYFDFLALYWQLSVWVSEKDRQVELCQHKYVLFVFPVWNQYCFCAYDLPVCSFYQHSMTAIDVYIFNVSTRGVQSSFCSRSILHCVHSAFFFFLLLTMLSLKLINCVLFRPLWITKDFSMEQREISSESQGLRNYFFSLFRLIWAIDCWITINLCLGLKPDLGGSLIQYHLKSILYQF